MREKVVVGMSGGVDSSVAAALLKDAGYEVIGITMQVWPDKNKEVLEVEGGCCSLSAVDDARHVCDMLGIRHYVLNFKDVFEKKVIEYFIDEYLSGRTPNPCIACNRHIKFDMFLRKAENLGASYVATGHYARIAHDMKTGRYVMKRSADTRKDQTYALYNLTQYQLSHTLMPLGAYTKDEVRKIAAELGLKVANKKDSEEICFIPDNDYGRFLKERRPEEISEGYFVDIQGSILGKHRGIAYYTIGQRKGLGQTFGKPMYVVGIGPENNTVVLGDNEQVFSDSLTASELNFLPFDKLDNPMEVGAKIRYTACEAPALIIPDGRNTIKVKFNNSQRAITPGQSVVFYKDDMVIGGGIINGK